MKHSMLVATELTTEDMLDIFMELAKKLTWKLEESEKKATTWKHEFEMYRNAWIREAGGPNSKFLYKSHEIDGLALTTKWLYERAMKWEAYQQSLLNRNNDPFWDVPEPPSPAEPHPDPNHEMVVGS